ncbi:hypothetical protein ONE63_008130 [Megalurothrips usitatus]|uniref:Pre-C2HC domain-containing protein n=1 Tax=Megalurothrips usitatus TaxID=439358 RepID=A0AAV7XPB6_9NEOP|nr:hypothetical protein ONE63_008130 [Megalurothrips usitatus]
MMAKLTLALGRLHLVGDRPADRNAIPGQLLVDPNISKKHKADRLEQRRKNRTRNHKQPAGQEKTEEKTKEKAPRLPPPILITGKLTNYQSIKEQLLTKYPAKTITLQPLPGKTKISCTTYEQHGTAMKYLESVQAPAFTYGDKSKTGMQVIIRGLPKGFSEEEIAAGLAEEGITAERVFPVNKNGNPLNLYKITLKKTEENKKIWKLERLCHHKITAEEPYTNGFTICTRCLEYEHTANYCIRPKRCAACPGKHTITECPVKDDPEHQDFCQNCNAEGHRATDRRCQAYRNYEDAKLLRAYNRGATVRLDPRYVHAAAQERLERNVLKLEEKRKAEREENERKIRSAARKEGVSFADKIAGKAQKERQPQEQQRRQAETVNPTPAAPPHRPDGRPTERPVRHQEATNSHQEDTNSHQETNPIKELMQSLTTQAETQQRQMNRLLDTLNNLLLLVTQLLQKTL